MTADLYGAPTGNCIRAAIALEEAGLPYVCRAVDLGRGDHRLPGYLALNPAAKVPTLVERRPDAAPFVLTQSNAIVLCAAASAPGRLLPLHEGVERAVALERFFYFVSDVIAPSHAAFFLRREGSRAGADLLDARSRGAVALAETFVADAAFMAGATFTVADIAAVTILAHWEASLDWAALPNLRRWMDETRSRPAVERGFRAFGR